MPPILFPPLHWDDELESYILSKEDAEWWETLAAKTWWNDKRIEALVSNGVDREDITDAISTATQGISDLDDMF